MRRVLNVILTHQRPPEIARVLEWWKDIAAPENILVAHGGIRSDFDAVAHEQKVFIPDPRLRSRDHQRDKQSHGGVLKVVDHWLKGREFSHIYYVEFDQLPLVADLNSRQLTCMDEQGADMLAHHVNRIDGTSMPHYLYHAADPEFHPYWERISVRSDKKVVLTMFGSGSFWKREVFETIACYPEEVEAYVEVYIPTLVHHLGWRVREYGGAQNAYVRALPEKWITAERARAAGAWTVHPIKALL